MVLQQIAAYVLLWFEGLVMSWSWTWSSTSLMDAHGDMSCHFALMKTFISNMFIRITWWGTSMNIPSLQVIPVVLAFFVGLRICEQRGLPRRGWQHRITSSLQVMRSSPKSPQKRPSFSWLFGKSCCLVQHLMVQNACGVWLGCKHFFFNISYQWPRDLWSNHGSERQATLPISSCSGPALDVKFPECDILLKTYEWKVSLSMVTSTSNCKKG